MTNETLISATDVSKKFCRRLRQSLWYGVRDIWSEIIGSTNNDKPLRKNEFWAVRDVSLELRRGETIGLIGPNGAGKTTVLRLINGIIKPDKGCIEITGRMQALISLGAGFNPILTGRENIYVNAAVLGISKKTISRDFDEIVDFSGVGEFIDTPLRSYSSGMVVRLGFAVAAHLTPDILLVDEVLAVGDEGFQQKCLNKIGELKKNGTGILLVSHNMHTISTFCEKVILMNNGKQKLFSDVYEGVNEYRNLFSGTGKTDIQKICSGNQWIDFFDVAIDKRNLHPGESFEITLHYESTMEYSDVQIDTRITCGNEIGTYFQAINKAYNQRINLKKGRHAINMKIENIQINNSTGLISFAIWTQKRTELLFWWKIPVVFHGKDYATGKNYLNVIYDVD